MKQIEWNLVDNRYTPELPEQGKLNVLSDETQYIDLVPYGCTELRLTVFPDADAKPLPDPEKPNYTRPADAPACVEVIDGYYYAYFEEPRFCWDEPIYCKVRTADDTTTDLHSNQGGDMCEIVGKTANGRYIWLWKGPAISEDSPVEVIFTNHDLLTDIMPFVNSGYYKYDRLLYKAEQSEAVSIKDSIKEIENEAGTWYTLDGRRLMRRPATKGIYIRGSKKIICE